MGLLDAMYLSMLQIVPSSLETQQWFEFETVPDVV